MYEIFEKLLKERNITAYRVAKDTGITTATLTDWKKGRTQPKMDKLQKIADYFGVSLDYLCGKEEKDPVQHHEISDEDIKFALFGGGPVTDAQYAEVKQFVNFIKERDAHGSIG